MRVGGGAGGISALAAGLFAALVTWGGIGAQGIPPLVAPPVPRVTPPPQPEILPPPALPRQPPVEVASGPPVHVDAVEVEGVTVYSAASLQPLYADIIGATISRARLAEIVQRLQTRYRRDGYILTVVRGEAKTVKRRLVFVIRVTEGYISAVKLDGDIGPAGALAYRFLQHLTFVRPVNNADLEHWLLLVEDIPGVSVHAVLRPSKAGPGAVELVAQLARRPFSALFQYDNRGSSQLGPHEMLLTGSSNAFTRFGEQFQAIFFNTFNREQIFGQVNASAFVGDQGLRVRGYIGRGNSQPGGSLSGLGIDSDLTVGEIGLSYPVIRSRRLNLSVEGAFDTYDSPLEILSVPFEASHLRILRGGAKVDFQDIWFAGLPAANVAALRLSQGLSALGAGSNERLLNDVAFSKVAGELTRVQSLVSFGRLATALKLSLGGQYTGDVLPPSEKYFLGGFTFGRGFFNGAITGDRALGSTVELQLNVPFADLPPPLPRRRLDLQFYSFWDYGKTWDLGPLALDEHISSVGIGVRSDLTDWLFAEIEGVHRLTTRPGGADIPKLADYAVFSRVVVHY